MMQEQQRTGPFSSGGSTRKRPKRVVPFLETHELLYGVRVTERAPGSGEVRAVLCMFCAAFGREDDPRSAMRQRARTQKPKYWGGPCFRTDNYKSHLRAQHPARWAEYQELSRDARRSYFDTPTSNAAVPVPPARTPSIEPENPISPPPVPSTVGFSEALAAVPPALPQLAPAPVPTPSPAISTVPTASSSVSSVNGNGNTLKSSSDGKARSFVLDRDVVDVALGDVLFRADDSRGVARSRALGPFVSTLDQRDVQDEQRSNGTAEYRVTVQSDTCFSSVVRLLAAGLSIHQTAVVCQSLPAASSSSGSFSNDSVMDDAEVAKLARVAVGANLQTLATLLQRSWAFALSLHAVNRGERQFLDVRLRVSCHGRLERFHLLALPVSATTSGEVLFDTTAKFLQALHKRWLRKVVGCSTEGAVGSSAAIAGPVVLAFVRRLEQQALAGLVRVSSARPQLDALLESFVDALLTSPECLAWRSQLAALSAYLRRQQSVDNAPELVQFSQCPMEPHTSWQSLVEAARWFDGARLPIQQLLSRTKAGIAPPATWWVTLKLLLVVGGQAAKTRTALQGGHSTLLSQQPERLSMLRLALAADVGIEGPLSEYQRAALRDPNQTSGTNATLQSPDGAFAAKTQSVAAFVRGLASWVTELFEALMPTARQSLVVSAGHALLTLAQGLHGVVAELEAQGSGGGSANLRAFPPVLPHQLAGLHPVDFQEIVRTHRARLAESFSDAQLAAVESQQRELRVAAASEAAVRQLLALAAERPDADFSLAWRVLRRRWPVLAEFCGGLATVFPSTDASEECVSAADTFANVAAASTVSTTGSTARPRLVDFPLEAGLQCQQFARLEALRELPPSPTTQCSHLF